MSSSLLAKSAQGASFLILLQISSRALTFVVNQILLRFLSPQILGIATQLELFSISTLYFSRESARVALQRQGTANNDSSDKQGSSSKSKEQKEIQGLKVTISVASISIVVGVPLTILFRHLYTRNATAELLATPYFLQSLNIYALATVLELLHEPFFATAQHSLSYSIRTTAELAATIARCLTTCGLSIYLYRISQPAGVLPFALGQLTYAVLLNLGYLVQLGQLPHFRLLSGFNVPTALAKLAATLYGQSLFKQLLTSGDSYLITMLTSLESQGAYALATNYGSLLARLLFQPLEEASRNLFSRLLAPVRQTSSKDEQKLEQNEQTSASNASQASLYLRTLLHLYVLMSMVLVLLPPIIPSALGLIAGAQWASTLAPSVLAAYIYYLPLLAINGLLEAYVASVATPSQLRTQSAWMVAWSAVFAVSGWIILGRLQMGARGLVWANCATMVGRISWSWAFVSTDMKARKQNLEVKHLFGETIVPIGVVVGARSILETLDGGDGVRDLITKGAILAVSGTLILISERNFVLDCWNMVKPTPQDPTKSPSKGREEQRSTAMGAMSS